MSGPSGWGRAIAPSSAVAGERVVVRYRTVHVYGRAISNPRPGEHVDGRWSLRRCAMHWIEFVSDADLPEYLESVGSGLSPRPEIVAYVPITQAWVVTGWPVPSPRSARAL